MNGVLSSTGGKLLKPVFSLLVSMGDGVMSVLHSSIMGVDGSLIKVETESEGWRAFKIILSAVLLVACVLGAVLMAPTAIGALCTYALIAEAGGALLFGSNFMLKAVNGAQELVVSVFGLKSLPPKLFLPAYSYSPEEIFKGKILLFNVNFFREPITIKKNVRILEPDDPADAIDNNDQAQELPAGDKQARIVQDLTPDDINYPIERREIESKVYSHEIHLPKNSKLESGFNNSSALEQPRVTIYVEKLPEALRYKLNDNGEKIVDEFYDPGEEIKEDTYYSIDGIEFRFIIKEKEETANLVAKESEEVVFYYYEDSSGDELQLEDGSTVNGYITSPQDSAAFLQTTISKWYNAIRNICLVLMLSVLIYIGIRILLSSVASDKAKYHTMLKDWFVGLCLLFVMHYIMAFSVTLVDKLTDVVATSIDNKEQYIVRIPYKKEIEKDLEELGLAEKLQADKGNKENGYLWPSNLMGFLRLKAQIDSRGWQYIGEAMIFITLVIFTISFTFTYLKRLLYMAFLTMIAPLVALTYCIDKLNDGQAQGFNKWLKEYIFNLLIQPMHLLLYYILVTSAFDFLGENLVYSMVAIGFMIPAEKLLRSLFGFEKAHTPPAIGPAAAMMASTGLGHLLHRGPRGKGGKADREEGPNEANMPVGPDNDPLDAFLTGGTAVQQPGLTSRSRSSWIRRSKWTWKCNNRWWNLTR